MNQNIEDLVRRELEKATPPPRDNEEQQEAPPRVSVEEALSAAIGDRPVIGSSIGLNQDRALAAIIGADTLEGKPLK